MDDVLRCQQEALTELRSEGWALNGLAFKIYAVLKKTKKKKKQRRKKKKIEFKDKQFWLKWCFLLF